MVIWVSFCRTGKIITSVNIIICVRCNDNVLYFHEREDKSIKITGDITAQNQGINTTGRMSQR